MATSIDLIRYVLAEVVGQMLGKPASTIIARSNNLVHGDYTSNIAMVIFKELGEKSPLSLAQKLAEKLQKSELANICSQIVAVAPGFINLTISENQLVSQVSSLLNDDEKVAVSGKMKNKKIMVEFTDPNPFKEFHIGHLYSNIVGESLCRLLASQGAIVKRVCYQGDVGLHVAKSLWGMKQLVGEMPDESSPLSARVEFMGKAYAYGASVYKESEEKKKEIISLNKKIYQKDSSISELYDKGKQWSLEYFEQIYKRLGSAFDSYYFESSAGEIGLALVKEYLKKGVFQESDGAVIFAGEKYGLHTRVFINSQGLPTYEAKELGLAPTKYKDFAYDLSIIITGNEIDEYFKVLLKALSLVYPDLSSKTKHISHGMVRLSSGKMSSRTGKIITGEWLLDTAKKRSREKIKEAKLADISEADGRTNEITEAVGVGAVKYAFLKSGIGRNIEFDFDQSISFEGSAGPYLQYTYARTQSVIRKSRQKDFSFSSALPLEGSELHVLRLLQYFPQIVEEAAQNYAPNTLCGYLFDLCQAFNLFYQTCPILISAQKDFRIGLTATVGTTLKKGLYLLGIEALQRM